MPLTEQARDYLILEGIKPETIIKIGSCMKEILSFYKSNISKSKVLDRFNLSNNQFLLSLHIEKKM